MPKVSTELNDVCNYRLLLLLQDVIIIKIPKEHTNIYYTWFKWINTI